VGTIESTDFSSSEYPYSVASDVCIIERFPLQSEGQKSAPLIAAGYSNGEVKIWNYLTRELKATLRGHKSAVSCLVFCENQNSNNSSADSISLLASGGKDCDIIVCEYFLDCVLDFIKCLFLHLLGGI